MDLLNLKNNLDRDMKKGVISARVLLNSFSFIDEDSRKTGAYDDPRYMPFFYHLGKYISPKNVLEIGFNLGLFAGCLFKSCKTCEYFLGFREADNDEYFSTRIALKNVKKSFKNKTDVYVGDIHDEDFQIKLSHKKWDLVFIDEEISYDLFMMHLDTVWKCVSFDGLVVVDKLDSIPAARRALVDFCKKNNKSPIFFNTRYGVGIINK